MDFALGLLLGGVAGVVLERIVGIPFDRRIVEPLRHRRRVRALRRAEQDIAVVGEVVVLGSSALFVRQFVPIGLDPGALTASLDASVTSSVEERVRASPVARSVLAELTPDGLDADIEEWRRRLDADPRRWNGDQLALTELDIGRTAASERATVRLRFRPSDYATFCAIGDNWTALPPDIRRSIDGDALREVDPLLSTSFGLNSTLETADGRLLITRRSSLARGWERRWHTSWNEGLSAIDGRPGGKVDIIGAFGRGLHEELGLDPDGIDGFAGRLRIHTVLLDVDHYQWGLLAHLDLRGTDITANAIRMARNLGSAHDDWEASEIRFLPMERAVDEVLTELGRADQWVPHGLLNVVLSMAHRRPERLADLGAALIKS